MNKGRFIAVGLVFLILGGLVAFRAGTSRIQDDTPESQLVDQQNQPVNLDDFRGKVLFVNNWASWCPPCIAEMPSIQSLKQKMKGMEVVFLMVSFDENPNRATSFIKKKGFDFTVYFPGKNYPFITSSIPATFIVNKAGVVVASYEGMADYDNEDIFNQLKELTKQAAP